MLRPPPSAQSYGISVEVSDGELQAVDAISLSVAAVPPHHRLLLTGVVDGPLAGGTPKSLELFAVTDITDLSDWGLGVASNGGGSPGVEAALSGSVGAGSYLYVASEAAGFTTFFGFAPDFTSAAINFNGDDAVELYYQGAVADTFGDADVDGSGTLWEYTDGWAYRQDLLPPRAAFDPGQWSTSGIDALDGATDNASATVPAPVRRYLSCGA